ncbi:MAG: response regulator [Candidatus Binatia bacterium]
MPRKILIVEDHVDSREILKMQIHTLGYEVIEAVSGEEALEKALVEVPDLIIMDLGLPGMNGIEAAAKLKQQQKTTSMPVLAYTAWREEEIKEEAEKAGIAAYLTKPAELRRFRELIQKLLKTQPTNPVLADA